MTTDGTNPQNNPTTIPPSPNTNSKDMRPDKLVVKDKMDENKNAKIDHQHGAKKVNHRKNRK